MGAVNRGYAGSGSRIALLVGLQQMAFWQWACGKAHRVRDFRAPYRFSVTFLTLGILAIRVTFGDGGFVGFVGTLKK